MAFDMIEALAQLFLETGFSFGRHAGLEQRRITFMNFGGNEIQPHLQPIALDAAGSGSEFRCRRLIGDVLHDRRSFRQDEPRFDFECRHITVWIDSPIILPGFGALGVDIDLFQREAQAGFAQYDMGRKRAGVGGVIQFHGDFLSKSEELNQAAFTRMRFAAACGFSA
jgi:hypothetical protein